MKRLIKHIGYGASHVRCFKNLFNEINLETWLIQNWDVKLLDKNNKRTKIDYTEDSKLKKFKHV